MPSCLAPNRSIFLIRVDETQLLVGVTSSQISTLATWDSHGILRDSEAAPDWPEAESRWPAAGHSSLFASNR